ncbi:MAG: c-type cytochrome biogenesis protein CcmI [Rhodospirillales bacterium]|nr:c-type cytochrome biogenesis protein CcmI [Rhodospirillales bacterium]
MTVILLAILSVAGVGLLLVPVLCRRRAEGAEGLAVYRQQLDELERDVASGLVAEADAARARREIERRILAEGGRDTGEHDGRRIGGPALAGVSLGVVVLAVGVYAALGSPDLPGQALNDRADVVVPESGDVAALIARAKTRVANDPFDAEGWALLANAYALSRRYGDAAQALVEALALDGGNARQWARYGEYIALSRDSIVTPAARLAFLQARRMDPDQPIARYYEGIARAQDSDIAGALTVWRDLLADSSPGDPWTDRLRMHIAEAENLVGSDVGAEPAPGPTGEDIAAAAGMTADEQMEMIRGMVDGLAARLEDEPDNLEGWSRLAQSYGVLGEWQNARDAYDHALGLAPEDTALWDGFANAVLGVAQADGTVPQASVTDMDRVLAVDPANRQALYVTGLAASQSGDTMLARERWTALRNLFPAGSAEHRQAQTLIDGLE